MVCICNLCLCCCCCLFNVCIFVCKIVALVPVGTFRHEICPYQHHCVMCVCVSVRGHSRQPLCLSTAPLVSLAERSLSRGPTSACSQRHIPPKVLPLTCQNWQMGAGIRHNPSVTPSLFGPRPTSPPALPFPPTPLALSSLYPRPLPTASHACAKCSTIAPVKL